VSRVGGSTTGQTPAERPKRKRSKQRRTPEQREARNEKWKAGTRTPDQKAAYAETQRKRWAAYTPEQRAEKRAKQEASRSPEQREKRKVAQRVTAIYKPHEAATAQTSGEIIKILDGAMPNAKKKVRGFVGWEPEPDNIKLLTSVQAILEEYRAHLPLTIRQILYRLMGGHVDAKGKPYEKTIEGTLYEMCQRARRARVIPMDAIRDDSGVQEEPQSWEDANEYIRSVQDQSQNIWHDRQEGQQKRLVVYCEAAGMVPQLARVANPFGVSVISSGGFDSLTEKHLFGQDRYDIEVLHIGDFDPSGIWCSYRWRRMSAHLPRSMPTKSISRASP
jgi:hypothetical protein